MAAESKAKEVLNNMFIELDVQISPKTPEYDRLLKAAETFVGAAAVSKARCKNVMDLLTGLHRSSHLGIRKFDTLKDILKKARLEQWVDEIVNKTEREILQILGNSANKGNTDPHASKLEPEIDGSRSMDSALPMDSPHEADGAPSSVPAAVASATSNVEETMIVDVSGAHPNPSDESEAVYDGHRGYVLILNYNEKRKGTKFDVDGLEHFFEDQLSYKVIVREDLLKTDVEQQLERAREQLNTKPRKYDFFFLFVLCHGEKDNVLKLQRNNKLERIYVEEIVDVFRNDRMENFVGCPKVFIIQACQGSLFQPGMETDDDGDERVRKFLPRDADILLASSTTPGFVAFRNSNSGSIFIQGLLKVLHDYYQTKHLETMLTIVKRRVAEGHGTDTDKQMPCTWSTLIKDLHLRPNEK